MYKRRVILQEDKKIVGISPITMEHIEKYRSDEVGKEDAIKLATREFLRDKLKMDEEEINDLKILKITKPMKENLERVYIQMDEEEGAKYIYRKAAQVKNEQAKISMFVPPQFYKRFNELSKHTFNARKENKELKTQIRLGDNDLTLLVKHKGEREWENEP